MAPDRNLYLPLTDIGDLDVETTVYQDRSTTFNNTMQSLATDTEVDRFVDSLILPDDLVLDSERTKVIFTKGVAIKQISVKVASDTKFLDTKMRRMLSLLL